MHGGSQAPAISIVSATRVLYAPFQFLAESWHGSDDKGVFQYWPNTTVRNRAPPSLLGPLEVAGWNGRNMNPGIPVTLLQFFLHRTVPLLTLFGGIFESGALFWSTFFSFSANRDRRRSHCRYLIRSAVGVAGRFKIRSRRKGGRNCSNSQESVKGTNHLKFDDSLLMRSLWGLRPTSESHVKLKTDNLYRLL